MSTPSFIDTLIKSGLGEYLVLHVQDGKSMLGNISYEKGKPFLRDGEYLKGIKPETLKPCWDRGLIGMICAAQNKEWESMTYYGLSRCNLPVDLESTRYDVLQAAQNQYGERLLDFDGSIYRGFNLLLNNHFLPVVLLQRVSSRNNEPGLAVTDLRAAPLDIALIQRVHNQVREMIDRRGSLQVEDTNIDASDFRNIFSQYLEQNSS